MTTTCMNQVTRKQNNVVSEQIRHIPACTSTEDGYRLEILDLERRGILYYPCSENKGADQLRSYCDADLRLCFRICRILVFSRRGSNCFVRELVEKRVSHPVKIQPSNRLCDVVEYPSAYV